MRKDLIFYLVVLVFSLVISIPLLLPYLKSGYFPTHDGEWAVVRLVEMFRELRDLHFPPRYSTSLNFGYGYPLFNFAYPFPYYVGSIFYAIGFGFVTSIKLVFALTIPISAFFMFLASREIWKNNYAGIVSSVLYLYFPYRLVDLYVRGSLGESVAFALFPIIILCIYKSFSSKNNIFYLIFGAITYGFLILSHNIMAVLFSLSLLFFFIFHLLTKRKAAVRNYLFVGVFGLLFSAYFWLPALLEKSNIALSLVPIADRNQYFVTFQEFLFDDWGYDIPTERSKGFSYRIGWPFLIVIASSIFYLLARFKKFSKTDQWDKQAILFLVGILVFIFMLFPVSNIFWKIPILSEINFPWTFYSQIGLFTSLLAGFLMKNKITRNITLFAVAAALFLYLPLAKPIDYIAADENKYINYDSTTTSSAEYMPVWVVSAPVSRYSEKVEIMKGDAKVSNLTQTAKSVSFDVLVKSDNSHVRLNTLYYPGWKVYDFGEEIDFEYAIDRGVINMYLSEGEHRIYAEFKETNQRKFANALSVIGVIGLMIISVYSLYKLRRYGKNKKA